MPPVDLGYVQACYLVDEANMITREVRPEEWHAGKIGAEKKRFSGKRLEKGEWNKIPCFCF